MQLWQLKQRFFGRGQHLAKYPAWKPVYPKYDKYTPGSVFGPAGPRHINYLGHTDVSMAIAPFGYPHIEQTFEVSRAGNLDNAMYQYLLGHPMGTSSFAQCRTCLEIVMPSERAEHGKKHDCFKKMAKIIKELNQDECVVCSKWTAKARWGLPLCSPLCQELWKFEAVQPAVILAGVGKALGGASVKD